MTGIEEEICKYFFIVAAMYIIAITIQYKNDNN